MEKPEYEVKDAPIAHIDPIKKQLNDMYSNGYEFVTITLNHMIYKKSKKPKKD
jgi:hypothetical protein